MRAWLKSIFVTAAAAAALATLLSEAPLNSASSRYFGDDPLSREPETEDASRVVARDTDLFYDFVYNSFATPRRARSGVRAGNVNTIDEVPDSGWYTNRLLDRTITSDAVMRGPNSQSATSLALQGPGRPLTVIKSKSSGAAPGIVVRCADGETWFLSFDPKGHHEAATGALMVATRLFWALGYNVPEHYLARIDAGQLVIADSASVPTLSGRKRPMTKADLEAVLGRAARSADGTYRVAASRLLPGRIVGPFKYEGTRNDDPNDVVPHEHRRELRALGTFGAWTNLVDIKANNTLDTVVIDDGRAVVRHYLQDVGSAFGIGANGPHDYDEGFEHIYEGGALVRRMLTFGLYMRPWQTEARYDELPAIGRFESETFEPEQWRSRLPAAALLQARTDDEFWASRRVAEFSDEMIRAAVATDEFSDPAAARYLGDVLIARRDKITRAYLPAVNPLVDFSLSVSGTLTFANAAVDTLVAGRPAGGYRASWAIFDNTTGSTRSIGPDTRTDSTHVRAPATLPVAEGTYLRVAVSAPEGPEEWREPVEATFRRTAYDWQLVGVNRTED
jgi:hypothetical protein